MPTLPLLRVGQVALPGLCNTACGPVGGLAPARRVPGMKLRFSLGLSPERGKCGLLRGC